MRPSPKGCLLKVRHSSLFVVYLEQPDHTPYASIAVLSVSNRINYEMLTEPAILIIIFLGLIAAFWLNSIRAKEIAMQASANACAQIQAQFLDQTASLKKIRFMRDKNGRLGFQRIYGFDFSRDRENRLKGLVIMNGHQVNKVLLDEDSGTTIL